MIAHNVYFTLNDNSEAARSELVGDCKRYLADHAGILSFACGPLAADHVRPVNVRDFDVGLHIVFEDKEAGYCERQNDHRAGYSGHERS